MRARRITWKRGIGVVSLVLLAVVVFFALRRDPQTSQQRDAPEVARTSPPSLRPSGQGLTLPMEHDPPGALRLEGVVLEADDQPVGDAVVFVSGSPPREVVTEQDGSFAFDALLPRSYTLLARAGERIAGPVTVRLTATSDPVTLHLRTGAALSITVVDAGSRTPVVGATVEVRDLETRVAATGDDGIATIEPVAPGLYQVAAWARGFGRAFALVRVPSAAAPGQVAVRATLVLHRGAPVSGVVRDPDGGPVVGAVVSYVAASEWLQVSDPRRDSVVSDEHGRYWFEAIAGGSYRFVARAELAAAGSTELVTVDGEHERSDVDITLERSALVAGRVIARDGQPVADAIVRATPRPGGSLADDSRQVGTDDDGRFEIQGLPRGEVRLVATSETAASEALRVDLTDVAVQRDLVLSLDQVGTIAGVVVDSTGAPIADATVSAGPQRSEMTRDRTAMLGRTRTSAEERTDGDGHFVLRGLADGEYSVHATRPGSAVATRAGGRDRMSGRGEGVPASTGDTDIRVVLESLGGVKGRVTQANGAPVAVFAVRVGMMGAATPFASDDGAFEIADLSPRQQSLRVSGPDFDPVTVTVEVRADEIVDLGTITVMSQRKVSGTVVDQAGDPVAGAVVVAGRRLRGSGAEISASVGPASRGSEPRTATTDEAGVYVLRGIGTQELTIAAEHETLGRSAATSLPGSAKDSRLDLILQPLGAAQGTVTSANVVVEAAMVVATSQRVPSTQFSVLTGPDGVFRFDRLAPDRYLFQASVRQGFGTGVSFTTLVADVLPGDTVHVDLDIQTGSTVIAHVALPDGGPLGFVRVRYAQGELRSTTARQLELDIAMLGEAFSGLAFSRGGADVEIQDVPPGMLSVCAVPFPREIAGPPAAMEYEERVGDSLLATCASVVVGATSASEVTVTISDLPPYVPPPAPPEPPPTEPP